MQKLHESTLDPVVAIPRCFATRLAAVANTYAQLAAVGHKYTRTLNLLSHQLKFLKHDAILAWYKLLSCPPVLLSVTSRHCTRTARCRITQTTPYDRPGTLVPKISAKFQRHHLQRGAK